MRRRRLLRTTVAALAVAVAGCGGDGSDDDGTGPTTDDETPTASPTATATAAPTPAATATETPADGTGTATDTPTDTATATPPPADQVVTVGPDGDFSFAPESFEIAAGETVRWVWDSPGHNVIPDATPEGSDWEGSPGGADMTYQSGYSYSHTFTTPGEYKYVCTPHENLGMGGSFTVTDGETAVGTVTETETATPTETETATPTETATGTVTETVDVTVDNVGASAWEVTEGGEEVAPDGGNNPTLSLSVGTRYDVANDGWSFHPFAFRDADGEPLLSQSADGEYEDDDAVDWVDDGDTLAFTVTDGLATDLDFYICTNHSSMRGDVDAE